MITSLAQFTAKLEKNHKINLGSYASFDHYGTQVYMGEFEDNTKFNLALNNLNDKSLVATTIETLFNIQHSEFSKFTQVLNNLKSGEKYTLLTMGDWGHPVTIQFTCEKVTLGQYAQHMDALFINGRVKRKRSLDVWRFYGNKPLVIWAGWVFPDADIYNRKEVVSSSVNSAVYKAKYRSCDQRYITDGINSIEQKPLIINI